MDAQPKFQGPVSAAFLEIEPADGTCTRILLRLVDVGWIEFTGVILANGFLLPDPLGCECFIYEVSDSGMESVKFEIEFRSSYSRDGAFSARTAKSVNGI
jgi:hypothetical protein